MDWFRRHLTYANVMSTIGVFIALGGVSYAALKLPKNSVGSKQIKKNAVKSGKIKAGAIGNGKLRADAVTGDKVLDGSIGLSDLAAGSVDASKLLDGSVDSNKIADGSVATGDLADDAVTDAKVVPGTFVSGNITVQFNEAAADLGNGAETSLDVHCLPGQIAIGGGARGDLTNSELTKITASRPIISTGNSGAPDDNGTFTGWRGTFVNENNGMGIRPNVWVVCAGPTP
jgi:hypothetical protein